MLIFQSFATTTGMVEIFGPEWNENGCDGDGSEACDLNVIKQIMVKLRPRFHINIDSRL